jgi:hypothetical protein
MLAIQVEACMSLARVGKEYSMPAVGGSARKFAQAVESMATEEMRKKAPGEEDPSRKRQLGEMIRDREDEVLEGDHKALYILGEPQNPSPTCMVLPSLGLFLKR